MNLNLSIASDINPENLRALLRVIREEIPLVTTSAAVYSPAIMPEETERGPGRPRKIKPGSALAAALAQQDNGPPPMGLNETDIDFTGNDDDAW